MNNNDQFYYSINSLCWIVGARLTDSKVTNKGSIYHILFLIHPRILIGNWQICPYIHVSKYLSRRCNLQPKKSKWYPAIFSFFILNIFIPRLWFWFSLTTFSRQYLLRRPVEGPPPHQFLMANLRQLRRTVERLMYHLVLKDWWSKY